MTEKTKKTFHAYIYDIRDNYRLNKAVLDMALDIGYMLSDGWANNQGLEDVFKINATMALTAEGEIHFSTDPEPEYHFGQPLTMDFFNEKPPKEMVTIELPADDLQVVIKHTFTNIDISAWQMPNKYHEYYSDLKGFSNLPGGKL